MTRSARRRVTGFREVSSADRIRPVQMDGVDFWNRSYNGFGWSSQLGESRGGAEVSPYAAPARAADLTGLPPAFLDVGSAECLRDEVAARDSWPERLLADG